jgi:DNA-binding NarL/FixJ family response regulator
MTQTLIAAPPRAGLATVCVEAADPVTRAGIVSQLRRLWDVELVDRRDRHAAVAVVVVDAVDDPVMRRVHELDRDRSAIVLVVAKLDPPAVVPMLNHGVRAVLTRWDANAERLRTVVRSVAKGGIELPAAVMRELVEQLRLGDGEPAPARRLHLAALSPRERNVLTLVADGLSTREVARRMAYSERTIKNILHELVTRLQLRNRTQAVAYALRNGWI